MKRTWKVWVAAAFGLGLTHPIARAEDKPVAPTVPRAVKLLDPAAPAPAAAPGGVVTVPTGTEYVQQAGLNPLRRSPSYTVAPCAPGCPPGTTYPGVYPGTSPLDPNAPQQPGAAAPDTSFQASQGGTAAAQTNSPNMFGDLFGAKASVISLPGQLTVTRPGVLNGRSGTFRLPATPPVPPTPPGGPVVVNTPAPGFISLQGVPSALPVTLNGSSITENVTALGVIPNSPNAARVQNDMNGYFAPGTPGFVLASQFERQANPQATLSSFSFGPVVASFNGSELIYTAAISDTVTTTQATRVRYAVPTPGAGGVVGILKVSEDNSPFPRDRLIFTYDYFNNVPIGLGGLPVNRYQFGFEKTLFEGRMSFEVRVPFASTLSSNSALTGEQLGTEFGNVRLLGKALFMRGDVFNVSGGLGISLPTSDDISVGNGAGSELIKIANRSVQLAPFLAAILTPNDRFFAQAWYGFTFDTGGNPVTVDPTLLGTSTANIGKINSPSLQTVDGQIGYWVYQSATGRVRGVAPFLELHYAGDVGKGTLLQANNFVIGDVTDYNEFNISAGVTTRLGQNTSLAIGAAAPLLNQSQRTFDYQIGVRLNWYFGYTARQRGLPSPNSF